MSNFFDYGDKDLRILTEIREINCTKKHFPTYRIIDIVTLTHDSENAELRCKVKKYALTQYKFQNLQNISFRKYRKARFLVYRIFTILQLNSINQKKKHTSKPDFQISH
jgi:hypothetical protein